MVKKGVILAGGSGSRLSPLTNAMNKHMLPVGQYPMIYYPIDTMLRAGITDILIVTGNDHAGQFVDLLGDGSEFGCNIYYSYQENPLGIADALRRAEVFVDDEEQFLTILGDNIFTEELKLNADHGKIFISTVEHPEHYGVANIDEDGMLIGIEEKPKVPKSNQIVTGAYLYPSDVFRMIRELSPSARGELEITDLNMMLVDRGKMDYQQLTCQWYDCGESVDEYNNTAYDMKDIRLSKIDG